MDAIRREVERNFESARRHAAEARARRLLTDPDPLKEAQLRGIHPHPYLTSDRSGLMSSRCVCGYFAGHPTHN